MRYYRIVISDPTTNEVWVPNFNGTPGFTKVPADPSVSTYTSLNSGASVSQIGSTNPYAQMVELDVPMSVMHQPLQNSHIQIWGIGLVEQAQAPNLQGQNISIYGGMAAGFPLANPAQSGLLASGQIQQSFGNWIGTDMTLDVYMYFNGSSPSSAQTTGQPPTPSTLPLPASTDTPANIIFQWQPSQPLMTPLVNALQTAFPKYRIVGQVNSNLVWSGSPATGFFGKLSQLCKYVHDKSLTMINGYAPDTNPTHLGFYPGVSITLQNNTIIVSDNSIATNPKAIQFIDLVGQPTWNAPFQVQVSCVLRGDINVLDYVTLPQGQGTIQQDSKSQYLQQGASSDAFNPAPGDQFTTQKNASIFNGVFQVIGMRHVGSSRQPDAQSWITTLDLRYMQAPSSTVDALPVVYSGSNTFGFYLPS